MTDEDSRVELDPNVGERFRHTDPRFANRTIRITGIRGEHPKRGTLYTYETVTHEDLPEQVGRVGKISEQTLEREYERISK